MKKNIKIMLIFIVLVIVIIGIFVLVKDKNNNNNNDNKDNNISNEIENELTKSKEVSNVTFSNIEYKIDKDTTIISMKIFNKNDKSIKLNEYVVNIYDKDNNLLGSMNPYMKEIIEANKSSEIEFSKKEIYKNAYSLEILVPNLELIDSE